MRQAATDVPHLAAGRRPETGRKFWWVPLHVNDSTVIVVLDTASHSLLIGRADSCDVCPTDMTAPTEGRTDRMLGEKVKFGADSVVVKDGKAQVCHTDAGDGLMCRLQDVRWIERATTLGFSIWGVGPAVSGVDDRPGAPTSPLSVLGVMVPPRGVLGQGGDKEGIVWFKPILAQWTHVAFPLVRRPAVHDAHRSALPCVKIVGIHAFKGAPTQDDCTFKAACAAGRAATLPSRCSLAQCCAMLDTGTPGTLLPLEWAEMLQTCEEIRGERPVDASSSRRAPPGSRVRLVLRCKGPAKRAYLTVQPVFWRPAKTMLSQFGCIAIVGSVAMEGAAWEFDYRQGCVRAAPLVA